MLTAVALLLGTQVLPEGSHQATGVRVGEVTPDSAVVWMRLTAHPTRNRQGIVRKGPVGPPLSAEVRTEQLEGACPGAPGRVRLRYGTNPDLRDAKATPWVEVTAERDYAHQFHLRGLKPDTVYFYSAETAGPGGSPVHTPLRGQFRTAPPADRYADVLFTVVTCHMYQHLDDPEGFRIYDAMAVMNPRFIAITGDNVYYDNEDPRATTVALARYHWERMWSLPRQVAFLLRFPAYWQKDDHDTLCDDCYPSKDCRMAPMSFADGQRIFLEQVPMGDKTYRRFRWGRGLEIWLTEGRDFRSPNDAPDGPNKTIWGAEQKKWLMETLLASDADFKILISPTPLVGPDRPKKADSHANRAFAYEGNEFRRWVRQRLPENFFVICGDRHWQYHSVDPETGLHEFACGPVSDEHAGGSPGYDPKYHRFHRVAGGFLSVRFQRSRSGKMLVFRHHDVHGKVVYEYQVQR